MPLLLRLSALVMALAAASAMTIARAAPENAGPPPPKAGTRSRAAKAAKSPSHPVLKQPAPDFQLPDTGKKLRKLSEFRGRPVALFFFCGCSWCAEVAREWSALQRGGALPAGQSGGAVTVVVYAGLDAEAARNLAAAAGLDPARTVLLPDPDSHVSARLYQVDPCPRAFVVDAAGVLRYTNQGADEAPRVAPGLVIASRTLDALQAAAPVSSGPRK